MTARTMTRALWLAPPVLVLVRTFWCQLHGGAEGGGLLGFDVAVPWALKAALGWILAAVLLVRWGDRLLCSAFAARRPGAGRALLWAGIVAIAFGSETWLLAGESRLWLWTYERLPLHTAFAALLLAGYLLLRARAAARPEPQRQPAPEMLEVMTGTGRARVRVEDIECLESDRNYVSVHTPQRSYLLRQSLASLELSLQPDRFLRVHRSTIVNRAMIRERRAGGVLVLSSGRTVRVSRAFADRVNC